MADQDQTKQNYNCKKFYVVHHTNIKNTTELIEKQRKSMMSISNFCSHCYAGISQ